MKHIKSLVFCIAVSVLFFVTDVRSVLASNRNQDCIFLLEGLEIPDDSSWIRICIVDPSAPEIATISETNLKLLINHPDPSQLEIQLTRSNFDIIKTIPSEALSREGTGFFTQIHNFDGLPSQGLWIIHIRDMDPGIKGDVRKISITSLYSTNGKMPLFISENDGRPTSKRIAADAVRLSSTSEGNEKNDNENISEVQQNDSYSVPIMTETFELSFPSSTLWSIFDANGNLEYFWDDDNLSPFGGLWAAWPARGGANGIDPTSTTKYPNDMNTWMIYGPFDLSNAKSANITFMLWRHIETYFDQLFFGISGDGTHFYGWEYDGSADWEENSFNLSSYLGDDTVWIGWNFTSDYSVGYEGPWIDDIMLNFEPGDVTMIGNFAYADRLTTMRGAKSVKVQLWDWDISGNDLLAETFADSNGNFSFPALMNWDIDDSDPILSNRRLDLYIRYVLENGNFRVTNYSDYSYAWVSSTRYNINIGTSSISASLPPSSSNLEAMWIFQDIRRAWEYYLNRTNPQVDPGFISAHWEKDRNIENGINGSHFWAIPPHVFIAHDSRFSVDTIVHEIGHHIMWNKTGQWLWYDNSCFIHDIFTTGSIECGWSEGWADFFAIAVNGDACYDRGIGPCTGNVDYDYFDLENHTRNDANVEGSWWGDGVEGRVAGALYDLIDSGNETPWYDTASWGSDPIMDIAMGGSDEVSFYEFWGNYQGNDKHNGIRAIYQNTIDYDQEPVFTPIPDHKILQDFPLTHMIDLWDFSNDPESPDAFLTYQIISVSDARCGINLDSHWINANPQMGWIGSCYVTVRANDSIKTTTGGFWVHVMQINSRIFLPINMKD